MPKSKISRDNVVKLDTSKQKKKKSKPVNGVSSSGGVKTSGGNVKKKSGSTPGERHSLQPLREQLQILVDEANRRVELLSEQNLADSRAMTEAQRTAIRFHRDESGAVTQMFNANLPSMRDLSREIARVRTFLGDETSMIAGALRDKNDIETGLFGGQYRAMYGTGYDITRVSKEEGDLALEVYHKVLELGGGWERVISHLRASNTGLTQYGSEELIQHIYDMVTSEQYSSYDADALAAAAYDEVKAIIKMNEDLAERQRLGVNYGLLDTEFDADRYDQYIWREERRRMKQSARDIRG